MKTFLSIIITLAVGAIVFIIGIRQKWWKNPFEKPADGGGNGNGIDTSGLNPADCDPNRRGYQIDGSPNFTKCGVPVSTVPITGRSLLVDESELSSAPRLDANIDLSTMGKLYLKATDKPVAVATLIHYASSTRIGAPHIYWWYKNGHYTYIKTEAGKYFYTKSVLPDTILLVKTFGFNCYKDWYLSGNKYKFKKTEKNFNQIVCAYQKQ